MCVCVCFITAVPVTKPLWGEGDSGGHVLRETTSRDLCGLVCPSRTSECGKGRLCERRRGRRRGAREGECTGAATMPQPLCTALDIEVDPQRRRFGRRESDCALQRNDWQNATRLKRNESDWLRCDDITAAVKCASVSRWACRKRRRKNSPCMRVVVVYYCST